MIIGLDRAFKPEWVYKILKLAKPGREYSEIEPDIFGIIEYDGIKSKKNTMTIIKRYFLETEKIKGKEIIKENYLHDLSLKYLYESLKPVLLFVFLCKCEIARFIQKKINLMFGNNGEFDSKVLLYQVIKAHGDRRSTRYAVMYYLTILSYFDILNKTGKDYSWKTHRIYCPEYIIKEMIILFANSIHQNEIKVSQINEEVAFSLYDISRIEDVLREYNSKNWIYQKRLDSARIIITSKNV